MLGASSLNKNNVSEYNARYNSSLGHPNSAFTDRSRSDYQCFHTQLRYQRLGTHYSDLSDDPIFIGHGKVWSHRIRIQDPGRRQIPTRVHVSAH